MRTSVVSCSTSIQTQQKRSVLKGRVEYNGKRYASDVINRTKGEEVATA